MVSTLYTMVEYNKYDTLGDQNVISNLIYGITLTEQPQELVNGEMYIDYNNSIL